MQTDLSRLHIANAIILSAALAMSANALPLSRSSAPAPLFRSSGAPLQYTNVVDDSRNVGGFISTASPELSQATLPGDWGLYRIPTHSGTNVLRFAGASSGGDAFCAMRAYSVRLPIDKRTKLSYWMFPQQENAEYVGVDLYCTDGTLLSKTAAVDQNGKSVAPASGHGGIPVRQWSQCASDIGKWLAGKTVDKVLITYHRHNGQGQYRGYIDDIVITEGRVPSPASIAAAPALSAPSWAKDGLIYCVSIRQFSANGDLRGVDAGLGRLCELGVTTVWLMPINTIGKLRSIGSPYCVRGYYSIDPRFGTADDLRTLVADAHRRGMKVILDETLDHTSWDNDLIAKHPEWYRHDNAPLGTVDHNTSTISRTPYWADVAQLDYDHADLRDYMTQMLRYWVKTFDVDGFRFDSGELMPTEFWNQASTALRAVKPDILLLGESHRPESMVRGFNLDYSFTLYSALSDVLHKKVPASAIKEVWEEEHAAFPRGALHMQYAGNQDTEKPAAAFGVDAARALAVLTFTLDGVPMLYNGAEIDDASPGGFLDGAPIDWAHANAKSEAWYRKLISVREYRHALMSGTVRWVPNEYPDKLLTFIREDGKEQILVIINLSDQPVALNRLRQFNQFDEIDPEGDWTDESPSDWAGHGLAPDTFDGKPFGYAIYVRDKSKASE